MWSVEFSREATKALLRMPREQAARIRKRIDVLARDPIGARNVKKLTEHPGYRLRVGNWRVLYLLDGDRVVIQIVRVAHRREVYR